MALRYYLDEDAPHHLAAALRAIGYNADSVKELGALDSTDARQLLKALDLGRTMATYNKKDYRLLHEALSLWSARWQLTTEVNHHGILILPHLPTRESIGVLDAFAGAWQNIDNRLVMWSRRAGWQESV